jgi:hypothetical protein
MDGDWMMDRQVEWIPPRSGEWSFMEILSWHDPVHITDGRGTGRWMVVSKAWCTLDHKRKVVIVRVPEDES